MRSHRKSDTVDNKKDEARWADRVKVRDGYRCRFEEWNGSQWVECGTKSRPHNPLFAAHVYGRDWCGDAKFMDDVGITACLDCHDRYDSRSHEGAPVRVPPEREEAAYTRITSVVTKFTVPRKLPPERPE